MPPLEADRTEAVSGRLLEAADRAAQLMEEAENDLRAMRAQFDQTSDEHAKSELADAALARVEGQIELMRERRRSLDRIEGKLWARRNRLERFLIGARGREWWNARRERVRSRALTSGPIGRPT
jgi:vacuolar-type H+-ATPase subunit H